MMGKRDYFPLFLRYRESFTGLTDEQVGRIIRAAIDYATDGKTPRLSPVEAMAFAFIRGDIDRAAQAYEERCEKNRRAAEQRWGTDENGSSGADANAYERMQADANDAKQTNKQSSNQSNNIPSGGVPRARTRGGRNSGRSGQAADGNGAVPPTMDEINAYCDEAGLVHMDRQKFRNHYAASGWMRGGEPIRDWKALARIWDAEEAKNAAEHKPAETSFETDSFFEASLARSYAGYDAEGRWTGDES
jgi:hypothetical protein